MEVSFDPTDLEKIGLKKIEQAIKAQLHQLELVRESEKRLYVIERAIISWKPPQADAKKPSERDAAVSRAAAFGPVSNGRPQFFIPDLGE